MNFNEIPNLKAWGEVNLIPKLNSVNKKLIADKELRINYSRVETSYNDSCYSWMISCITTDNWIRSEYCEINEVVVSISCRKIKEYTTFDFDISFGDGDIFFEIPSMEVPVNLDTTIDQIGRILDKDIDVFLSSAYEYVREGVLHITKMQSDTESKI